VADTSIAWTNKVWNPVTGCEKIATGCKHCYAERMFGRNLPEMKGQKFNEIRCHEDRLEQPRHWRKPARIFVDSMGDLFHKDVPFEFIDKVWDVMWNCPQHTFIVLTKRVERMVEYVRTRASARSFGWIETEMTPMKPGYVLHMDDMYYRNQCGYVGDGVYVCDHPGNDESGKEDSCDRNSCPIASTVDDRKGLEEIGVADEYRYASDGYAEDSEWMRIGCRPKFAMAGNVQLGFSASNQADYDAAMNAFESLRWILGPYATLLCSLEPLTGPIETKIEQHNFNGGQLFVPYLNWVIAGGESGPGARHCNIEWLRAIVEQCKAAKVSCFVKQLGAHPVFNHEQTWQDRPAINGIRSATWDAKAQAWDWPTRSRAGSDPAEWPADLRVQQFPEVAR
jgi:protein gp37